MSNALWRVEVERACLALGEAVHERARDVLARFDLVRIGDRVLGTAGGMLPCELRSLDAIHLATASPFGASLKVVVTYDVRMRDAARGLGWKVMAPS